MLPIRVFLVEDHPLVRQGIRSTLEFDPAFVVIGEAGDGQTALRLIEEMRPDIVLLDLHLPDLDGTSVCQEILHLSPQSKILVLTAFFDETLVNTCLQAGARGYLLKDIDGPHLKEHLLAVAKGLAALDPKAAAVLTGYVRSHPPSDSSLRPRDIQILRCMAQGLTSREISEQLHLSENTVKGYIKEILSRLGTHSRVEAVLKAKEQGWL